MHIETLVPVRYSDLILPSDAEIKEAQKAIAIAKASIIVIPPPSIKVQFVSLLNNPQLSDLTFICEGNKVHAHSVLLKLRSEYFRDILATKKEKEIQVTDCTYNILINALTYIYTDTRPTNGALELLKGATPFKLIPLITKLEGKDDTDIVTDLGTLVNNPLFYDVEFIVGEKVIPGHKLILETRSEHFRRLFSSGLKESQSNTIVITDCTYEAFLDVLRFIYTDACHVGEDNCISLLEQANFFQLDRLKAICESFWYKNINITNAGSVLEVADRFNAKQLKDFSMEFIFKNIKDVVNTPAFQELDQGLISSILIASVERGK